MSEIPLPSELDGDLWDAQRYVEGEMTAAEESAFEARLAEEQPLRECVAAVVETRAAVRAVESETIESETIVAATSSRPDRRRRLVAGLLAASVLVAVTLSVLFRGDRNDVTQPGTDDVAIGDDAGSRVEDRADDIVAFWATPTVSREVAERDLGTLLAESEADVEDDDAEFVVPGWMLAAVEPESMDEMMDSMGGESAPVEN